MENYDIFVRTLLSDKIKLKPRQISNKLQEYLLESLRKKFEGICSYHGYIRPGSIEIFKYSMGFVQPLSLNGDVEYMVNYYADVCNPSIGSVVHTKVVNTNKFGVLTHTGIKFDNKFVPILEIVVAKNMINLQHDMDADAIKIGAELHVEILGKKFELTDKKISAIGRIINAEKDHNILDEPTIEDGKDDVEEVNDDDDADDEDNDEEEEEEEEEPVEESEADDDDDDDDDEDVSDGGGDLDSEGGFFSDDDVASHFGSDGEFEV